jgi:UDP-N-acetyl-D-glucosamine dehydrogenase
LKIMALLEERGARVAFHDPHCPEIPTTRDYPQFAGRRSAPLDRACLAAYDAALVCTDHDAVDYRLVVEACPLVVDTRNICARLVLAGANIVKA